MYYFDSAYVAKCYLNEPDADSVRNMVRLPIPLYSSALCVSEVTCAIHRRYREALLTKRQTQDLAARFREHVERGTWTLVPVSQRLLWEVHEMISRLPAGIFLRSADAIHLASARTAGFSEVWTNDRHMLEAAEQFGLRGRSV